MYFLPGGGYLWIVLLIVLGLAAYFILQNVQPRSGTGRDSPLDILKKRFARGEINREQFDEMKKKLEE
ncbi:MAG: SHOCT domain-containing protein [Deltaproteobacteria bacterium]|nr:SHOCT domain-containing protein [Deltaproteobacteria bacterium]